MKKFVPTIISLFCLANVFGQATSPKLVIKKLTGDFYIYTTYNNYKGTLFPSNGMYLVTNKGVVIFDTPWDSTQFQPLLDSISNKHGKKAIISISTHSHADRTAGLAYFRAKGIKTYATRQTDELCRQNGEKRATCLMNKDTVFTVGQYHFQTYYGGSGHTPDNIVIWFPREKILYGGCLIKSVEADNLGNMADADINQWGTTLRNIQLHCKNPEFIIPGHQDWSSNKSLDHTLDMVKKAQEKIRSK